MASHDRNILTIAKQAAARGIDALSGRQRAVVDSFVEDYKNNHTCEMCVNGNMSIFMDYIEIEDHGICSMCRYDNERLMKDNL